MRRSMLFLPGNNPNMLINGNCLGSDAIIFDLEDAVSPAEKDAARILVRNTMKYMDFKGCELIVRVNSVDTDYFKADIDTILAYKPDLILLPKTSSKEDVLFADAYMSEVEKKLGLANNTVGLMPLIETAMGVENIVRIGSAGALIERVPLRRIVLASACSTDSNFFFVCEILINYTCRNTCRFCNVWCRYIIISFLAHKFKTFFNYFISFFY